MTNHLQCSPTVTDEWIEGAYKIYCDSVCVCVCARARITATSFCLQKTLVLGRPLCALSRMLSVSPPLSQSLPLARTLSHTLCSSLPPLSPPLHPTLSLSLSVTENGHSRQVSSVCLSLYISLFRRECSEQGDCCLTLFGSSVSTHRALCWHKFGPDRHLELMRFPPLLSPPDLNPIIGVSETVANKVTSVNGVATFALHEQDMNGRHRSAGNLDVNIHV